MIEKVIAFAKDQGYESAVYLGKWREFEVYKPVFGSSGIHTVGLPFKIVTDGNEIRMTTTDETFAYMREKS